MNAGEIVIAAVGAAGGVGGAVFTWVQAKAAVGSRKEAETAKKDAEEAQRRAEEARDEALELSRKTTAAAERQATAQEEANWLKRNEMLPDPWSGLLFGLDGKRSIKNLSGQDLVIEDLKVVPEPALAPITCEERFPLTVLAGMHVGFRLTEHAAVEPQNLVLTWRYAHEQRLQGASFFLV